MRRRASPAPARRGSRRGALGEFIVLKDPTDSLSYRSQLVVTQVDCRHRFTASRKRKDRRRPGLPWSVTGAYIQARIVPLFVFGRLKGKARAILRMCCPWNRHGRSSGNYPVGNNGVTSQKTQVSISYIPNKGSGCPYFASYIHDLQCMGEK
jgi:hypothetical protein